LEQDRSGVRSNDDGGPLSAESVWDLARAAGLEVAAISELPWWRELFPRGFSRYQLGEESDDFFAAAPAADLLFIHPLYIDAAGPARGPHAGVRRRPLARSAARRAGPRPHARRRRRPRPLVAAPRPGRLPGRLPRRPPGRPRAPPGQRRRPARLAA